MVTHCAWLFLSDSSVRKRQLQEIDWLALLCAAVCHDLEHPGTTNSYQVNTASPLALRYNDASVLESHHCAVGWSLMERAGLIKSLSVADAKAFRKLVVAAILATDMVRLRRRNVPYVCCCALMRACLSAVRAQGPAGASQHAPERGRRCCARRDARGGHQARCRSAGHLLARRARGPPAAGRLPSAYVPHYP
jgi:hypothetical protein